jgi:hypothetical protein
VAYAIASTTSYTFPGFIDSYRYKNGVTDCKANSASDEANDFSFSLYPSPVSDELIILFDNDSRQNISIKLRNESGTEIFSAEQKASPHFKKIIDVAALTQGIYFLEITFDKVNFVRKIIKQ